MMWIILLAFINVFCVFMIFRTYWVYKIRTAYTEDVSKLMNEKIGNSVYSPKMHLEYLVCVWNFHRMMRCFWVWDLRRMVTDKKKFDEVYGISGTDDLEAMRKKVMGSSHVSRLSSNVED